jgi:hypothetical protein
LTPLPSSPSFTIDIRWRELPWKLAAPKEIEAIAEDGSVLRRVPVAMTAGDVRITSEPDVFSYRLR